MKEKVLLAYSGGLDTSCILKWLLEKNYEVICFLADVGQQEDFEAAKNKAMKIGASNVVVKDCRLNLVNKYVWPAIQMGLIYEGLYLLGTSLARPCISEGLIEVAAEYSCKYISHGATGKGNDQIRFELSCYALNPDIKVIAPWRIKEFCDKFQGREDLLDYAKLHGIPITATKSDPWSTDANIMHISYESGILEDPSEVAPERLYNMTLSPSKGPDTPTIIHLVFKEGLPIRATEMTSGKTMEHSIDILTFLNVLGGEHGVGRIDIVENRFLGLKSRGVYESPGMTILYAAHHDIEVYCMDREVYRVKRFLADKMSDYVYNGFWFSPEAQFARKCLAYSQINVSGNVSVEIFKGNVRVIARESSESVYNQELASMNVHGTVISPFSATGFIDVNAMRLKEYNRVHGIQNK